MNQQHIIKKLTTLKKLEPRPTTLRDIRQRVYEEMDSKKSPFIISYTQHVFTQVERLSKPYRVAAYGIFAVCFVVLVLSFSFILLPTQMHSAILYTRLTFASNQYERARIAFSDTMHLYMTGKISKGQSQEISASMVRTNRELAALALKGEKGKYTAEQCHIIYAEYLRFLDKEDSTISSFHTPQQAKLHTQIIIAKELAERRLHMYSSL